MIVVTGGAKMEKFLKDFAKKIGKKKLLSVGFTAETVYPESGLPVAYVAAIQEFGGTATIPAHDVTINRSIDEDSGEFKKKGRFVKKSAANFQTTHHVDSYTITIPPRPFFRRMISLGLEHWGDDLGQAIKHSDYEADKALELIGEQMVGELRESILANVYHPLAASTIRKKGHTGQLVDTSLMSQSVTKKVEV
jgi:hypothetical protein